MSGAPNAVRVSRMHRLLGPLVAVICLGGCDSANPASAPTSSPPATVRVQSTIQLPPRAWPAGLAFASNGNLWVTESSVSAIARITPEGKITQYRIPGQSNSPTHILEGPDGQMWFTGFMLIGRVDNNGRLTGWEESDVGIPRAFMVGKDGAVWYTNESAPPRISRIDRSHTITHKTLAEQAPTLSMNGIVTGPDDATWFTIDDGNESGQDAIGRLTTGGTYTKKKLPPESDPAALVIGPDGALWFTMSIGIGRMALDGTFKPIGLADEARPRDILTGSDGAIWFITDTDIGRITMAGVLTRWSVPNAKGLTAAAFAADRSLWVTDREADTVVKLAVPA